MALELNRVDLEKKVAELEQREKALQKELNLYKLAIDSAELGIWDYNPGTGYSGFSSRWLGMLGYEPDELPATYDTFLNLLHPDDKEATAAAVDDFVAQPKAIFSLKFRLRSKNGEWHWIHSKGVVAETDPQGMVSRMVGVHFDITDRQRLEIELRTTRFSFDNAPIGIYRIGSDARILDINQQAAMNLGYSVEEMCGMTLFDIDPDVKGGKWKELWQVLNKRGNDGFERVHRRKDGTQMPVEISSKLLEYDGKPFAISFVKDITERKNAEKEKEYLQKQLLQAQRMESVGHLAGGIAHDFNNILSVIIANTELAMRNPAVGNSADRYLKQIQDAACRSSDLVKQLLAFARKQTIKPVVLDINETIAKMLGMLRRLIGENIQLAWVPSPEQCRLMLDPSQIDQLLANMMVNAKDAIEGTGKVTIETRRVEIDESYRKERLWFKPGIYVMLSVSDTGCGMDRQTQERIFDPFFTTKGIGRGTGLGLATVYGIVRQNKGFIHVYSEIGRGTTFKLYFPATEVPVEKNKSRISPESTSTGTETVLIVEDDPGILEVAGAILRHCGYTVMAARAPGQAVDMVQSSSGKIDLLLTDVVMPMMNGRELAQCIEEIRPGIKCLYMSGYTADVIADHGVLNEGVNFLSKPFTVPELARKVREVLDG